MTHDPEDLQRAAAWRTALDADARGERPLSREGWTALSAWLEGDPRRASWLDATEGPASPAAPPRRPRGRRIGMWARRAAIAAVPAAAALAVALIFSDRPPSITIHQAPSDSHLQVVLPDGSRVMLNRGARLEARLTPRARQLRLSLGSQALFDVVHDPRRPLVVWVDRTTVSDLGTRFDIDDAPGRVTVAVSRGVVAVQADKTPRLRVAAGQALTLTPADGAALRPIDPSAVDGWTRGVLLYDGAPLPQVAAALSRYSPTPIRVDPDAASLSFTGALAIDKAPLMVTRLATFLPIVAYSTPEGVHLRAAHHRR